MKKLVAITILVFCIVTPSLAKHIKGGEIYYKYLGPGSAPNTDKYQVSLRLFVRCDASGGQLESIMYIGIYRNSDNAPAPGSPFSFPLTYDQDITLTTPSPCIVNPDPVCYKVRVFSSTVELPKTPLGYSIVNEQCCRIDGIRNEAPNTNIGASYICRMHGTNDIGINGTNSSPVFLVKDTVLICQNRPFTLNFGATDDDNDSLSYQFASAYDGGGANDPQPINPRSPNQLSHIGYASGFSGILPMGPGVSIDPRTGVIAGLSPPAGDYVVSVLLKEWRNGINISQHYKDFIIHVDDRCDFASAALKPSYITCDGFNFTFQNETSSPLINSYFWDFGIAAQTNDTSNLASPTFVFPDTGVYTVRLWVNKGQQCSDSATTLMKVYPGFFPGFTSTGSCLYAPLVFTDTTKTRYGIVSSWSWNFGDLTTPADSSHIQNPSWKYSDTGTKQVQFIVANSKGCLDTVTNSVHVLDKPPIILPFNDTLICSIDTLQLQASGTGTFSWTPNSFIINPNTPNPFVYPKTTTTYTVSLNNDGCINTDVVQVRVVDFVTLNPGNDSTICLTDTITLNPAGDGLYFVWSPAASLDDPTLKNPKATPVATTTYHVVASIGKCNTSGDVTIRTVPYPGSFAGPDTTICYQDTAQLNASIVGSRFTWSPANTLVNPSVLNPLAFPDTTTIYTLYAYDNLGCPKPGISFLTVNVIPKVNAFAGNDTAIVVGQPLQLSASGAPNFLWTPSTGLNEDNIQNPVAVLNDNVSYILKAYTAEGCFGLDTINIKVFKTAPDIFVPNAFTPGKGSNNVFRPIPVGISSLQFFRVYNRWGQMVYSTSRIGQGWDGLIHGKNQDSGSYVWMVQGTDYTGKTVFKKGVMTLIR